VLPPESATKRPAPDVTAQLPLVRAIAQRIARSLPPSFDIDDLVATGNVALVQAARRYRKHGHNGASFATYASHVVRGAILDSVRRKYYAANTMISLSPQPLKAGRGAGANFRRDVEKNRDERSEIPDLDRSIDRAALSETARESVAQLPRRLRRVIELYYSRSEPTMAEVGRKMGVCRQMVSRLHAEALSELRGKIKRAA
jgi:RNA polymerase sigma factor (sigma-70 family)